MKNNKTFKIGIYVRVSTEEQAENPEGSIKNQEQRIREFIRFKNMDCLWGEIVKVYCDSGLSAKNMQRPNLQQDSVIVEYPVGQRHFKRQLMFANFNGSTSLTNGRS